MKTCPDCGCRVYELGCVNCCEEAYIEQQAYFDSLHYSPKPCPACEGTGSEPMPRISSGPSGEPEIHACPSCGGTGKG